MSWAPAAGPPARLQLAAFYCKLFQRIKPCHPCHPCHRKPLEAEDLWDVSEWDAAQGISDSYQRNLAAAEVSGFALHLPCSLRGLGVWVACEASGVADVLKPAGSICKGSGRRYDDMRLQGVVWRAMWRTHGRTFVLGGRSVGRLCRFPKGAPAPAATAGPSGSMWHRALLPLAQLPEPWQPPEADSLPAP